MYSSFRPGKVWYDTDGKRIQAHGGSIICVDNVFYWYGENKDGITGNATGEKCKFWHKGVNLYSSVDLYNWKSEGVFCFEVKDKKHPFHPANIMDRPHIIFNKKTNKYVLWAKCCSGLTFSTSAFAICVSDSIKGPFKYIKSVAYFPFTAGDFDMFEEDGKGYIIYENPHTEIICQTLTDDYTDLTEEYSSHLKRKCPPYTREAPAFFARKGRKFLLTSGTTGYYPNTTQLDELSLGVHKEWTTLGNPCVNDVCNNSFHSQFSSVFKHPFIDDLYIALGDRWLIDIPPNFNGQEIFERMFDDEKEPLPKDFALEEYSDENTSEANYVFLPIQFKEDGTPYIIWKNEWRVKDFTK